APLPSGITRVAGTASRHTPVTGGAYPLVKPLSSSVRQLRCPGVQRHTGSSRRGWGGRIRATGASDECVDHGTLFCRGISGSARRADACCRGFVAARHGAEEPAAGLRRRGERAGRDLGRCPALRRRAAARRRPGRLQPARRRAGRRPDRPAARAGRLRHRDVRLRGAPGGAPPRRRHPAEADQRGGAHRQPAAGGGAQGAGVDAGGREDGHLIAETRHDRSGPYAVRTGSEAAPMKRVAVFGNTGGGKSTLARRLAEVTGLPLYPLDLIQFRVGGDPVPDKEYATAHAELLRRDEWVIDGYGTLATAWERFNAADTLV